MACVNRDEASRLTLSLYLLSWKFQWNSASLIIWDGVWYFQMSPFVPLSSKSSHLRSLKQIDWGKGKILGQINYEVILRMLSKLHAPLALDSCAMRDCITACNRNMATKMAAEKWAVDGKKGDKWSLVIRSMGWIMRNEVFIFTHAARGHQRSHLLIFPHEPQHGNPLLRSQQFV